ncbi:ABC transporter substrate-binding protein [Streptomyces sp. NPDC088812]|uniref:ABC transporter substrate-binding protein n=1 Tax=Streptomyces sp. NPDC088812 TaxID=3365905 RepID=UPI003828DA49
MLFQRTGRTVARTLMAAAMAALTLTGCAVGKDTGADRLSEEGVTLRLDWWGSDERQRLTAEAVQLFEKKYPRIDVELEYSDWTGYWDRLATMTAAGSPPDVIQMDQLYLSSYADRGALLDLDKSKYLDRTRLSAKVLDTGRYKTTLYAVPSTVTVAGIAVNTTLLKQLGLELPDTTGWTWDEYDAFAQEIARTSGGKTAGTMPLAGQAALEIYTRQSGDQVFTSDGRVGLSAKTLVSFWNRDARLIESKATLSTSQLADAAALPLDQSPLATGKTAMSLVFANQLSAYAEAGGGDKFVLVDFPTAPNASAKSQYVKSSQYWSISTGTQHPAEAALLVNFLTGDKEAAKVLGVERGLPAVPELRDVVRSSLTPEDREAADFVESVENGPVGSPPAITPTGASDFETTLTRYGQEVMFGQRSAEDAAEAFLKETADKIYSAGG